MEHVVKVVGYTDRHQLDLVQLRCSCGWMSDELDSGFFTLEEINERAAGHLLDVGLPLTKP